MSAPKKLGRPAEVDKNKIMKVARTLFAESGFEASSTRQIAEKVGCNVAMIGYYFGNKEGLLDSIIDNYFREAVEVYARFDKHTEDLSHEFPEFKDPEIRQFCKALVEFGTYAFSNREIHQIMIRDAMSGGKLLFNSLVKNDNGVVPLIHQKIRHFIAQKKLPADTDINCVSLTLIGAVTTTCISSQVASKIHGFDKIDENFFRRVYVFHIKNLFRI